MRIDQPAGLRLVVLGDPIDHSKSPAIHQAALDALGMAGTYTARRVDAAGVVATCDEIRRGELDGANITMPHKRVAAAAVDALSPNARRADSVNTMVREPEGVVGYTTDVDGIRMVWEEMGFGHDVPVLLLGGGGAAGAALLALEGMDLYVATRRPGAGAERAATVGVSCPEVPWATPIDNAVVVNATPIGMAGEALPEQVIGTASGLFDMVYGEAPPPSVAAAREHGIPATDGMAMLVAQAARSFELWTGIDPPRNVMEQAARSS